MATYAIGDVQGCYRELNELLDIIEFSENSDTLWFAGDLVNRGPQSLEVLRFVRSLGDSASTVLGNHDIHLLSAAFINGEGRRKDTFDEILAAPDRDELLHWLRNQALVIHDKMLGYYLVHAGVAPQWDRDQILDCAAEVENELRSDDFKEYLKHIYGDQPDQWSDDLAGMERLRCITNIFTRLRFCDQQGVMNLTEKGSPGSQPIPFEPWYQIKNRQSADLKIIFGHWSTHKLAELNVRKYNVFPIDTGCLWGGELTAFRLDDESLFHIDCNRLTRQK